MEAYLPSHLERVAAKALLLLASNLSLSSKPPSSSTSCCYEDLPLSAGASDSSSSLLTTGDCRQQSRSHTLNVLATAARCVDKRKKKKRKLLKIMNCDRTSKCKLIFFTRKTKESLEAVSSTSETGESSLTSGNPSLACIGSRNGRMKREAFRRKILSSSESTRLRPRAEAILKFLAAGRFPEYKIREAIGNSPDTSKALRMLVRQDEVKRTGRGGRSDPFIYEVAGLLSDVDSA